MRAVTDSTPRILTIGHSNHRVGRFVALLHEAGVTTVVDVRSVPFSRRHPQFRRSDLERTLDAAGIGYRWLPALGGRPTDPALRDGDGNPRYDLMAATPSFAAGVDDLLAIAHSVAPAPVAVMCAEEDPDHCHRRLLVTPPLVARGIAVAHLRGDGRVEPEVDQPTLFG